MRTSIDIHNRINALRKDQAAIPADAENRDEQLYEINGRISELDAELSDVLAAEDGVRKSAPKTAAPSGSFANRILGDRAAFKGLELGFKNATIVLPTPESTDREIPRFGDQPRGFVETILGGTADGDISYFRRKTRTNSAAAWGGEGVDKAQSVYEWEQKTALRETIAHWVPISKRTMNDYGELEGIINDELLVGLDQAKARAALVGTNASGITGILKTAGILTSSVVGTDNIYDAIRRAITRVYLTSGFRPTHVALAPQVLETMDLLKDKNDGYLRINAAGTVWSLKIVEDINLVTVTEAGVSPAHVVTTHYGALVYYNGGAAFKTVADGAVSVGLTNKQFIQNELTMLAEGDYVMKVPYPDAFCSITDAIVATEVTD